MEKNIELLKLNSSMFNIYFLMYIYNTKSYRSQTISNFNAWKKITTRNNSTFISSQYLFFESYFSIMKKIIHIKHSSYFKIIKIYVIWIFLIQI